VILTGIFAYKIKKPVRFDFIDASTLEKRRHLCEEEIRLNGRLAPELYLDVMPIVLAEGRLKVGGAGAAIEYAVRMKQFGADDELLALLRTDTVTNQEISELGHLIAEFHTHAPQGRVPINIGETQPAMSVLSNIAELATHRTMNQSAGGVDDLLSWTQREANRLRDLLKQRASTGRIRECHGDLHAGNIVRFNGHLVPFDCIEFNAEFRWIDVCNDIAFLFMDFLSHSHQDFAFIFLNRYLEDTGDYEAVRALHFYAVYRALVRAKVDVLAIEQASGNLADRHARAQRRIELARELTQTPVQPALILMQGVSGSGKSWLSERLLARIPAVRVRSDVERKRLAGLNRAVEADNIYSIEFNRRTYERARVCAEHALSAGFTTIIDATFLQLEDREPFYALAARLHIPHAIVTCNAGYSVLAARIVQRRQMHRDASDADLAVLRHQLDTFQPLTAAESSQAITARTDLTDVVETTLQAVRERIARFLR
jgi:aminoglycoside phosphotransferase family enzyme/predicted kinase